jgi:hypothetical protein
VFVTSGLAPSAVNRRGVLDAIQAANRAPVEAIDTMLAAHDNAERLRRSDTH